MVDCDRRCMRREHPEYGDYVCKSCPGFKGTKEEFDAVEKSVNMAIFTHDLKIFFKTVLRVCLGTAALFMIIYASMGCFFLIAGI